MMEKLKPCPFCGGEADLYERGHSIAGYCRECQTDGPFCDRRDRVKAITLWNTRADEWQPIATAPKDGTEILAVVRQDLATYTRRPDLDRWAGKLVPIKHPGLASDGFDVGWSVALPVGYGLGCDDWFSGWKPVPSLTATKGGE